MELTWGNIDINLQNLVNSVSLIKVGTDLLILPEAFSTGFPSGWSKQKLATIIKNGNKGVIDTIKGLSVKYNMAIAGSILEEDDGRCYNRAFLITPDGHSTYAAKHHLFSMAGEDKWCSPGSERLIVRYRGWNISMVVCYDIRFPVWCRNKRNEYDLLVAVANWPEVRIGAWEKLLPARAIENEAYVAGVNCIGVDDKGFAYTGSSRVYDYKGTKIEVSESPFIYAELNMEKLINFRNKFPAWKDADNFILS